jgi:NitT/TauT family transport system substrate-binding protein
MAFRIMPHGRLQEWVAEEKGYFAEEGLEYDFVHAGDYGIHSAARDGAGEIRTGAFETFGAGRDGANVSCACHWATNAAASGRVGQLVTTAYSVAPCAIVVPPESPIRRPEDLAGVAVGVGYHSGSHFATVQALEAVLPPDQVKLTFQGPPNERLDALLEREVLAATTWGVPLYIAESFGFHKVLDATFMIGRSPSAGHPLAAGESSRSHFRVWIRAFPDDVHGHPLGLLVVAGHPHISGPAGRPQDVPGGRERLGRYPGRAPNPDPLPERAGRGAQNDGKAAVPGLDPGLHEAAAQPVCRDDAPRPGSDRPGPRRAAQTRQYGGGDQAPFGAERQHRCRDRPCDRGSERELVTPPPDEQQEVGAWLRGQDRGQVGPQASLTRLARTNPNHPASPPRLSKR